MFGVLVISWKYYFLSSAIAHVNFNLKENVQCDFLTSSLSGARGQVQQREIEI